MNLSVLLAEQIAALFLIALVGFVLIKKKIFESGDSKTLSTFVVYVFSPCVIVNSFQMEFSQEKMKGWMLAAAAAVLIHILLIGGGKILQIYFHLNAIEKASLEYSNAANLIVPLVTAVLGAEWVFYTTAYIMVQAVLVWTHGVSVIREKRERNLKKILLNPNIIAIFVGFVLFLMDTWFPPIIASSISGLGVMIGPASMLVIGMLMGDVDLIGVFKQKRPYLICLLRLVLFPVLLIFIFRVTGMTMIHPEGKRILLVSLLAASAPVAAMVTQLAQIYERDAKYASVINVMSVVFCVITMPLVVFLYEMVI